MRRKFSLLIIALAMIAIISTGLLTTWHARASDLGTAKDAIVLASTHPAFANFLHNQPGWTAAAYYTGNSFQIWRVQFWSKDGNDLGWADVNVARKHVYSWQARYTPTDAQHKAAEEALRRVVTNNRDVIDLIGSDPKAYDLSADYDADNNLWNVSFYRDNDALTVVVQFQTEQAFVFERPVVKGIYFPNVMSYDDWIKGQQAQAATIAFSQPEVAAAAHNVDGWISTATQTDEGKWLVIYKLGDKTLAQATVDIEANKVVTFNVPK